VRAGSPACRGKQTVVGRCQSTASFIPIAKEDTCRLAFLGGWGRECYCGGGWRDTLYCNSDLGSEHCENGMHIVNCAHSYCDINDGMSCSASPVRSAYRLSEPDTLAFARPHKAVAGGAADTFDRWFSEKLRSSNKAQRIEVGGE